ncbi:MAG: phosphate signaling complex protein PhoU [bacterium]
MERHFDQDLNKLKESLLKMSDIVERMVRNSVKSLIERDIELANELKVQDSEVDRMENEIDEMCIKMLALHQPMAVDLRFITMALKINTDLERMADMAVNIGKCTRAIAKDPSSPQLSTDIPYMADLTEKLVGDSIDAFVRSDVELARAVCSKDQEVDDLRNKTTRILLTYMMENPRNIAVGMQLLLVSRHLERIADHATNIAEDVVYMVKGTVIKHHKGA